MNAKNKLRLIALFIAIFGAAIIVTPQASAQDADPVEVTAPTEKPATDGEQQPEEEKSVWETMTSFTSEHAMYYAVGGDLFEVSYGNETKVQERKILSGLPNVKGTMCVVNGVIWFAPVEGEDRAIRRIFSENGKWKSEIVELNSPVKMGNPVFFYRLQITRLRLVTLDEEGNAVHWNINPGEKLATPITVVKK